MDKNMLNSLLKSSGKKTLPTVDSNDYTSNKYSSNQNRSYQSPTYEESTDNNEEEYDFSRSNKLYDLFLSNLDNNLSLSPSLFMRRLGKIQDEIDSPDLSTYETYRLLLLKAALCLTYYDKHFLDDDYDKYEEEYLTILDSVDESVSSMSTVTDEAAYIYYIANMFSADRFKGVKPLDKLAELWNKINSIHLDEYTEWKASVWEEFAKDTHDLMLRILSPSDSSSNVSSSNNSAYASSDITPRVKAIIADKLTLDVREIPLTARLDRDLGADSLDAVELIMEIEKEFGITIPDEDAESIRTVADIVVYVKQHTY